MRGMLWLAPLVLLLLGAPLAVEGAPSPGGVEVGPPVLLGDLAIYPVYGEGAAQAPDVLTLDEACALGLATVSESGGIVLDNRAPAPILLLTGEILDGGDQDRALARGGLVPAHSNIALSVFCVEEGRGGGTDPRFAPSAIAPPALRRQIRQGIQQNVWSEVRRTIAALGATNPTHSYADAEAAVRAEVDRQASRCAGALDRPDLLGFVVAIGGEVRSADIFATSDLARRYRDRLVRSYLVEFLAGGGPGVEALRAQDLVACARELADSGSEAAAWTRLRTALAADPGNDEARRLLARVEERLDRGARPDARTLLARADERLAAGDPAAASVALERVSLGPTDLGTAVAAWARLAEIDAGAESPFRAAPSTEAVRAFLDSGRRYEIVAGSTTLYAGVTAP